MKKIRICLATASLIFAVFFIFQAKAQEAPASLPNETPPVEKPAETSDAPKIAPNVSESPNVLPVLETQTAETSGETSNETADSGTVSDAVFDMQVSTEDLGAKKAAIKPDSFWHPFKKFGRNVQEMLTFDPVKDAELKLKHANQELSEIDQLIEEKGVEKVDANDIIDSVNWFENKLEKIKDASEKIKSQKIDKPVEVDNLLNNLTDKQIKEHKILEKINEGITNSKEKVDKGEDIYASLKNTQETVLKHFGEVLSRVDEPEKISDRLAEIADKQKGSEFKMIKTTEIYKKLEENVPENTKDAISQAREKSLNILQETVKEMPPIVRAEKFQSYAKDLPGDETIQLSIFENLKNLPDIPQDMLKKIEEVKDFAVKRFEEKVAKFEKSENQEKFFKDLQGDNLDDLMVLEELKSKITAKQEEIKKKIDRKHTEGIVEFKKQFSDAQSQNQAQRFEKLVKEMTENPNPKTLKLIQELETEVGQDPTKKAFIEDIRAKSQKEFENKFRQEGDRFLERISTLSPEDMVIFQKFEEQKSFDPAMMDQVLKYQTSRFKDYVQSIDNTENFDRFNERFRLAPQSVIETIKKNDAQFGDVMQFKARKIMEMDLQLKENEARMKIEQEWKKYENDFQLKLRQARDDAERTSIYQQKREQDASLMEKEFADRQKMMELRFTNDPFCDATCQEFQRQFLQQEMENKKWNIQEDSRVREFEVEMKTTRPDQGDPFQGKCNTPETCIKFCLENPAFSSCKMLMNIPSPLEKFPSQGQNQPGMLTTLQVYGPPPCPSGQINMPKGPNQWECVDDPYQKISETFKKCPPGYNWNDAKAFCEFNQEMFKTACPQGEYWDEGRQSCIRPGMPKSCPPDQYFDPGQQACINSGQNSCPSGQYWDAGKNGCVEYKTAQSCPQGQYWDQGLQTCRGQQMPQPMPIFCGPGEYWDNTRGCVREDSTKCAPGEYFDFYEKRCKTDQWKSCPMGEYFDASKNTCIKDIINQPPETCQQGYFWDFYKKQCVQNNYTPPPQPQPCPTVLPPQCKPGETPTYGNCGPSCTTQPTQPPTNLCGNNICEGNETTTSCPSDCKTNNTTSCPPTKYNNYTSSYTCSYTSCTSGCTYDYQGCPNGCNSSAASTCGDKICGNGETASSCPTDCGNGGYTGDASSCPGFAYSKWDKNGKRYCQLNDKKACDYNYPSYLTNGPNYTAENCPVEDSTSPIPPTSSCPSSKYNDFTDKYACSYTACPSGCSYDYKGCPSGCITSTTICGNNICDNGETTTSCPNDCKSTPPPATGSCPSNSYTTSSGVCNYATCPNGCNLVNGCPTGCMSYSGYCGDNVCSSGETLSSCPSDCGGTPSACPSTQYNSYTTSYTCSYSACPNGCTFDSKGCPSGCNPSAPTGSCGDYSCNNGETSTSCPSDCGGTTSSCAATMYNNYTSGSACSYANCPNGCTHDSKGCPSGCITPTPSSCPSTSYNNYSNGFSCNFTVCPNGCTYDTTGCPNGCSSSTPTYSGANCGNNVCESGETTASCPTDCGTYTTPPSSGVCGNGACESSETSTSCPSDCGGGSTPPPSGGVCGNGACESSETMSSCPSDCGTYTPPSSGYCGDSMCNNGETGSSCPADCGGTYTPPPTTTPPPETTTPPGSILQTIFRFFKKIFRK